MTTPLQSPEFCTTCLDKSGPFQWVDLPDVRFKRCLCPDRFAAVCEAIRVTLDKRRVERWEVEG